MKKDGSAGVSRILCLRCLHHRWHSFLSRAPHGARALLAQSATNTRGHPSHFRGTCGQADLSSVLSCTASGLSCAPDHSWAGGLLPRLFTLTWLAPGGMFSVTLSMTGRLRFQPPRLHAARCPVVSGLSSPICLATIRSECLRPTHGQCSGLLGKGKSEVGRQKERDFFWRSYGFCCLTSDL